MAKRGGYRRLKCRPYRGCDRSAAPGGFSLTACGARKRAISIMDPGLAGHILYDN